MPFRRRARVVRLVRRGAGDLSCPGLGPVGAVFCTVSGRSCQGAAGAPSVPNVQIGMPRHRRPRVRIQFPPADSPSLARIRVRRSTTPAFRAGVRGRLGDRVGREAQGCFDIAPTGGNISVGPYSSTAVPLVGSARMPRGCNEVGPFSSCNVRCLLNFGSGLKQSQARSADRARKAADGSARGASPPSNRAAAAHRGSLG